MKLKCIGGNNDGQIGDTGVYDRVGDAVRIAMPSVFIPNQESIVSVQYNIYRICCFYFNKDERMLFLVPEGWTDREAIEWQFSK